MGWQRLLFIYMVVPVGLTMLGPFGTHADMWFGQRLLYWVVLVVGIGLIMQPCILYILRLSGFRLRGAIPRIVLGCAIASIPAVAIVLIADILIRQSGRGTSAPELIELWINICIVSVAISLMEMARVYLTGERDPVVEDVLPQLIQPQSPEEMLREMGSTSRWTTLHTRFQKDRGQPQDIISLTMQDHYVEITTTAGVHTILMRMRDAIQELEPLPGLKIHRSHWIADKHLRSLRREVNRWFATLSDGRELPVSQTFLEDAQQTLACIKSHGDAKAQR